MNSFKDTLDVSTLIGKQGAVSSWTAIAVIAIILGVVLYVGDVMKMHEW